MGGKGGVGKTTCAAALAIDSALAGQRTLVLSTDPAPSLGDALGRPLGAVPSRVPLPGGRLDGAEIDAHKTLERWLKPRRPLLETIALRGTLLDEADVRQLLRLSLPGIDELAALIEMLRFGRSGQYDVIVVDTAPTGHTLRMLTMPETLGTVAHVFDDMQAKHRALAGALRGALVEDAADALVAELRADARALAAMLRDRRTTGVMLVSLAETLAVEETVDAARVLLTDRIAIDRVVVNRMTPPPPERCGWCAGRRRCEHAAVTALTARIEGVFAAEGRTPPAISMLHVRDREPIGTASLRQIAGELRQRAAVPRRRVAAPRAVQFAALPTTGHSDTADTGPARLLLFGGKGGVGKTTCAAAAALRLASEEPDRRVLLVSTDPAHSLADVLDAPVSDMPAPLPSGPGNLRVRELDARRTLDAFRDQYAASVDAWFDRLTRGSAFDAAYDRRVMHDLLDLAPPGLDELAAVMNLVELLGEHGEPAAVDTIVIDTAPTGHTLRLLEMPRTVHEWTRALMSILLKYQPVVGLGEPGAALLRLSRGLGRLRVLLSNPASTRFVAVTRAAVLPRTETIRLARRLRRLRIRVSHVIVNAAGAGTCSRCRRSELQDAREIRRLAQSFTNTPFVLAPASMPPPVGRAALELWQRRWRPAPRGLGYHRAKR